jgi:hypothetical protein
MISNETKIDQAPSTEKFPATRTEEEKKIDRTAEAAAEKAGKTERHYDQNHGIFTK